MSMQADWWQVIFITFLISSGLFHSYADLEGRLGILRRCCLGHEKSPSSGRATADIPVIPHLVQREEAAQAPP